MVLKHDLDIQNNVKQDLFKSRSRFLFKNESQKNLNAGSDTKVIQRLKGTH